jgi:hypothetical protein
MSDEQSTPQLKSRRNLDWFLVALTYTMVSGFMAVMAALFLWHVPESNKDILVYMVGQLSGFASATVAIWTNTTHESSKKSDVISQSQPVKL